MPKEKLKTGLRLAQRNRCELSGELLPEKPRLFDTDRRLEKVNGGTYTDTANVRVVLPVAHMERHGNLRLRPASLDTLKAIVDARTQLLKTCGSSANRLDAYERRTDTMLPDARAWLEGHLKSGRLELARYDRWVEAELEALNHPMVAIAMKVPSVGPMTIAGLLAYVDINKANNASSLWSYTGLHKAGLDRYEKGKAGGGNRTLRTMLHCFGEVVMRSQPDPELPRYSPYRQVYDRAKAQKAASEVLVRSRNTQGNVVTVAWKDTKPCHRNGHAIRIVIKHFLADWWFVHRTIMGLPTRPLYVEEKLGHTGIVRPWERGWPSVEELQALANNY